MMRSYDTRPAGTGSYDPFWAFMWQAWMTVLDRAGIVSLADDLKRGTE